MLICYEFILLMLPNFQYLIKIIKSPRTIIVVFLKLQIPPTSPTSNNVKVLNVVRKRNVLTSKKCGGGGEETVRHKSGLKTFCRLRQRSRKKIYEQQPRNQPRGQMTRSKESREKSLTEISFLASFVCLALVGLFKTTSNIAL